MKGLPAMSETITPPVKAFRPKPNANPAGSGFLITLLERYADRVPGRTRREMLLAQEIDNRPGARTKVEEAVRAWRALPLETRVAAVGQAAATADNRIPLSEETLMERAAQAFRPRGVRDPNGFTARPATLGQAQPGSRPFVMREAEPPMRPGDTKAATDALTGRTETSADPGGAATVLGTPPPAQDLAPGREPAARGAGDTARTGSADAVTAPLYTLSYVGLYCKEESFWDGGSNSDEPYANFNVFNHDNLSWGKRTAVYSDVDRKETRGPDPNPMMLYGPAPLPAGHIYLSTLVTEHDFGDPEKIKQLWHDAATVGACVAKFYGVDVDQAVVDSAANLLDTIVNAGDDVIGWDSAIIWPEGWEWYLSFPLNVFKGIAYDFFLFHTDNDSEYYTFYRIDRW
jgi:hypothetical protein